MSIKIKAVEQKLNFEKGHEGDSRYCYLMQAVLCNRLSENKVIQEASTYSGISTGMIMASLDAVSNVVKAWLTEGHSVPIPGLGIMRFGIRAASADDVSKVSPSLVTNRRVVFIPSVEIKEELRNTGLCITCIDRNGNEVKRINSSGEIPSQETKST